MQYKQEMQSEVFRHVKMFVNEKYLNFSSSVSYDCHSIIWLGDSECWYSRLKGEINKFIHNTKMKQAHYLGLRMENLLTKETTIRGYILVYALSKIKILYNYPRKGRWVVVDIH